MNIDLLRAFIDVVEATPDLGSVNIVLDKGNAGKLTIIGQGSSIKLTIDSAKQGSRTITFDSIGVGNKNIHAAFRNLCEYMKIAYRKALTNKLDPEEFSMAVNGGDNDDDLPI